MPHRRMADPEFRAAQHALLHDERTAPITKFIDGLKTDDRWLPYVAPLHGGADSRMLSVLRDPGPATVDGAGSGMLCIENDDPTAELQAEMTDAAGIKAAHFLPWNAFPWYINAQPSAKQMREGTAPLVELISLLPQVKVVFLQGADAQKAWRLALNVEPELARLIVVETYHPGLQAHFHPNPAERERRAADRIEAWKTVGEILTAGRSEKES